MKVAIIGAGAAGLVSARRCLEHGFVCDVFEMTEQFGGIWMYTDETGLDKFGYPIHSPMYKGLRTNVPKEVMEVPGLHIREQQTSYVTHAEILEYLKTFVNHFNLMPVIKLNTMVTDIRPIENNKWQVTTFYKPTKEETVNVYDAVMVCTGHFSLPNIPKIDGSDNFKGSLLHCKVYRTPDPYRGKSVLIIGGGYSGIDITLQLIAAGVDVVLSHHRAEPLPSSIPQRPDVERIGEGGEVIFVDGTSKTFDTILFCTGYLHRYQFFHKSCGITLEGNRYIHPLYQHMINIERPTMAFVGLPTQVTPLPLFDIQARYFCELLKGSFHLPSKEVMRDKTKRDLEERMAKQGLLKWGHELEYSSEYEYTLGLAKESGIKPLPIVINKLKLECLKNMTKDLFGFREHNFRVVDDETFEEII